MADKSTLIGLLGKAIIDHHFRTELFKDRDAVAKRYQLTAEDREALDKLDESKLDEAASHLSNRPDITIEVQVTGHFDAK